jgi:hypothetical protein
MPSESGGIWNALGVARYLITNRNGAIEALTEFTTFQDEYDACDLFFQAMAHRRPGEKPQALACFDKAVEWMEKNSPTADELIHFRAEAADLLNVKETTN